MRHHIYLLAALCFSELPGADAAGCYRHADGAQVTELTKRFRAFIA
jgi:hypothetical protein